MKFVLSGGLVIFHPNKFSLFNIKALGERMRNKVANFLREAETSFQNFAAQVHENYLMEIALPGRSYHINFPFVNFHGHKGREIIGEDGLVILPENLC